MLITADLFDAFLKCPTKCWLRSQRETAFVNPYSEWIRSQNDSYRAEGIPRLLSNYPNGKVVLGPSESVSQKDRNWQMAANQVLCTSKLESCLDVIEQVPSEKPGSIPQFVPIRFVPFNKVTKEHKLGLAFDAMVLSEIIGQEISIGRIVYGDSHATLNIKTSRLFREVRKSTEKVVTLLSSQSRPNLFLNSHCSECEFQLGCQRNAMDKANLSLLAGMTENERRKLNGKGIFAVIPLSYTFRVRRRPKRLAGAPEKYHHSVKALAIRENKIHVVGRPELKIEGTPIYVDVESIPDRDFYYLIGVRTHIAEHAVEHSLWANSVEEEGQIWMDFVNILSEIERPILIHFGRFEKTFFKRMRQRYGESLENSKVASAITSSINLLSVIFAQIYFPTFSNSLKEIASSLKFVWSDPTLFGPNSIMCRADWEQSRQPSEKRRLITYNLEDCTALELLTNTVATLCRPLCTEPSKAEQEIVYVDQLKPLQRHFFINRGGAALPEFVDINRAAYWDYQRARVYVRSSRAIKKVTKKGIESGEKHLPARHIVRHPDPSFCRYCGSIDLVKKSTTVLLVYDVRFTQSGAKGWVTRHIRDNSYCFRCGNLVRAPGEESLSIRKYARHLRAYAIYQLIQLRISQTKVAESLSQLFDFNLDGTHISLFKSDFASYYAETVKELTDRIVSGPLIHADETKAELNRARADSEIDEDRTKPKMTAKSGYAWILASLEDVAYIYSNTREGELVRGLLKDFHGVLVSDFYPVYDGINCPQQKCLIHLMRDLNDDLHRYPYDEDLRKVAQEFANVLRPIVETIDKHGLKTYFLTKHLPSVEKLFTWLSTTDFASAVAEGYQKRFRKNRDKLFTFLNRDDIPWNNNNAENAARAFAELRTVIRGTCSEKGLLEYLVLLSICETCKRRGLSFLDFLLSGERSIEQFAKARRPRNRRNLRQRRIQRLPAPRHISGHSSSNSASESIGTQPSSVDSREDGHRPDPPTNEFAAWSQSASGALESVTRLHASQRLERFDHFPAGSALVALPALSRSGLWGNTDKLFYPSVDKSFPNMVLMLVALFCLTRVPFVEALHFYAPSHWRTLFYGDRLGNNRMLAEALRIIAKDMAIVASWRMNLAVRWLVEAPSQTIVGDMSLDSAIARFQKYEIDNVSLERLCKGSAGVATNEPKLEKRSSEADLSSEAICHTDEGDPFHLATGVRNLINAIKVISFRAEDILINILYQQLRHLEEADFIVRDLLTRPADLVPDRTRETLTVRLHPIENEAHAEMLRHLCTELNVTHTYFPGTDLLLHYEYFGLPPNFVH